MSESWSDLSDDELADRWLAGTLGGSGIGHLDHVRVAWVLVRRVGAARAEEQLVSGTRRASALYGVPRRFDEELTRRWAAAVAAAQEETGARSFRELVDARSELARSDLLGARPGWTTFRAEDRELGGGRS